MANIKFFRKDVAPSNPQEGYIWFNSSNNTIQLYKNAAWEIYTGKVNDVAYNDQNGTLTITKHDGTEISVPLGDVKNISDLSTRLGTLETNFNTLSGEFTTEKGKITTLQGEMTTVKTEVAKLSDVTGKVGAYVVEQFRLHDEARVEIDGGFESRISTLETGHTTLDGKIDGVQSTLQGAIDTEKGRIDTLVGSDSGSIRDIAVDVLTETLVSETASEAFDTLQEVSAWIKNHPENAATMNEAINGLQTWRSGLAVTDTAVSNQYVSKIDQVDGKIVITRESLPTIPDVTAAINALNSTVKDETDYITGSITQTNGKLTEVSFTATTGAVANSDNALAVASDVKSYVDST